jgi:enoyl-CoA hydratase/carnithine racemase
MAAKGATDLPGKSSGAAMQELVLEFEPPLARLRLNVLERRNAMSLAMWRAMPGLCAEIEARADARVVILEGAGGHFCAGADISEFDEVYRDAAATRDYLDAIEECLRALIAVDRPTIAKMEGSAVGGGLALATGCDLRFASEDAHLAVPPAKLGLLYGPVETRRLVELIGPARTKDLLFSGRKVETAEALAFGLIDRRAPPSELHGAVETYARDLAALSQTSIRGAKRMVEAGLRGADADLRALVEAAASGADFREGRAAFTARRRPKFG